MAASGRAQHRWGGAVRQVTKSNFSASLQELRNHIRDADYIAISTQKTGDSSTSSSRHRWRRVLPIDTPETAYLKAKLAAETFELFQFAVCPFQLRGSKVLAYPYNFHLFPRDEQNFGMPSYSFSCQSSFLTSMAREGFDFNVCIYDGISYLSRVQESKAKDRSPIPQLRQITSSPNPSVADTIFMGRIKSRIEYWRNACKNPGKTTDGCLVKSLRKLILGSEVYGSRPCLTIDVCSNHQVQLVLEIVGRICDDLVPLVVPDKDGKPKAVSVVLTSSEEDRNLFMSEIQTIEAEHNLKVRGFREVIDMISSSHKPIIAYNCLHDFAFIHSKFIAPLPPSVNEFMCSLRLSFSNVLDVNHMLKEVGPLRKASNLPAAISYLRRQFFLPIEIDTPQKEADTDKNHGHNVLRITTLFAKLSNLLKIVPDHPTSLGQSSKLVEDFAGIFYPCSTRLQEPKDDDAYIWMGNLRKVSTNDLVFLWGFRDGFSAAELKSRFHMAHQVFKQDFELQLIDNTSAVVLFWKPGAAEALLKEMGSGKLTSSALLISEDLKATGYETYKTVCKLGLWDVDLADSLENVESEPADTACVFDATDVYWNSDLMINIDEL